MKKQKSTRRPSRIAKKKPTSWRAAIDWVAAGKKAFATKMRNLGAKPGAPKPGAKPAPKCGADATAVAK